MRLQTAAPLLTLPFQVCRRAYRGHETPRTQKALSRVSVRFVCYGSQSKCNMVESVNEKLLPLWIYI